MDKDKEGYLTPPKYAEVLGVGEEKILGLIRTGELTAIDVAKADSQRPRYRISPEARAAFERSRRVAPPPPPQTRRVRRKATGDVVKFF